MKQLKLKLALPKVTQKDTINVNISEVYYLQKLPTIYKVCRGCS